MPAVASIVITVDEKGAVTAINNTVNAMKQVGDQVDHLGPPILNFGDKHKQVFNGVEGDYRRAHDAAALFSRMTGAELPRQLTTFLAKSSTIGPILSTAFNGAVILAFASTIVNLLEKIPDLTDALYDMGGGLKYSTDQAVTANKTFLEQSDRLEKLREQYRLMGLQGIPLFTENQKTANEQLDAAKNKMAEAQKELDAYNAKLKTSGTQVEQWAKQMGGSVLPDAADQMRGQDQHLVDLQNHLIGASNDVKVLQQTSKNAGKTLSDEFSKQHTQGLQETAQMLQEALNKIQAIDSATASLGLSPLDAINQKEKQTTAALTRELELYGDLPGVADRVEKAQTDITNAAARERSQIYEKEHDEKMGRMFDQNEEDARFEKERIDRMQHAEIETSNVEREAAIAMLPPWQRSYAEVANAAEQMQQRIEELHRKGELTDEQFARMTAANATEEFAHMRDQVASDLEDAFDDLTSGRLGDRVKKLFKDIVFQMIATWVVGMGAIKQATAGTMTGAGAGVGSGGGILGSLGGIFGIGSSGGSGAGGIATPPFVPSGPAFPGFAGIPLGNTELSPGTGVYASTVGALGLPIGMGLGIPGTLGTPMKPGGAASPIAGLLAKLFPRGAGGIFGGQISQTDLAALGIGLGAYGMSSLLSGRGNTAVGVLSTIGGGAAIGTSILPGVGTLIGGIIGGIASLFGWLFGRGKVDKQRKALETQLEQQLKLLTDSYDLHKTDYSTAMADAEQLRTQYEQAQDQVKKGANMQQYVGQWVDQTEKHFNDFESERMKRSETITNLALPEFASGGFTPSYLPGGRMPAILHPDEAILNSQGRRAIGDQTIAAANKGGKPETPHVSIGPISITINPTPGMDERGIADAVIRRLRQAFGDRGLSFGGVMG